MNDRLRQQKRVSFCVVLVLALACLWVGVSKWIQSFELQNIRVFSAYTNLHAQDIQRLVNPLVGGQGWVEVSVKNVQSSLLQLDWVKTATVEKQWPDTLVIEIEEPTPMALWNNGKIITTDGTLVEPGKQEYIDLPLLAGAIGQHDEVSRHYQSLSTVLRSAGSRVARFEVVSALWWSVTLQSGVVLVLEKDNYIEKARRFVAVYGKLSGEQKERLATADARYENGVAIRWKEPV